MKVVGIEASRLLALILHARTRITSNPSHPHTPPHSLREVSDTACSQTGATGIHGPALLQQLQQETQNRANPNCRLERAFAVHVVIGPVGRSLALALPHYDDMFTSARGSTDGGESR